MIAALPLPDSPPPSPTEPLPPLSRSGSIRSSRLSLDQKYQNMHDGQPALFDPESPAQRYSFDELRKTPSIKRNSIDKSPLQNASIKALSKSTAEIPIQMEGNRRKSKEHIEVPRKVMAEKSTGRLPPSYQPKLPSKTPNPLNTSRNVEGRKPGPQSRTSK